MSGDSVTALITGGTGGIGRAASNKLAQLGVHVMVVGRDAARGQKAGAAILSRYSPSAANPADADCVVDLTNQKWIRFRSFMELLEEVLLSMEKAVGYLCSTAVPVSFSGPILFPTTIRGS